MMRLLRPTVIALALLTSTATVSAECAWVLWTRLEIVTGPGSTDWGIIQASPNRADCLAALEKTYRDFKESSPIGSIRDGAFVSWTRDRKAASFGKCLPDTVDPRGPKGK